MNRVSERKRTTQETDIEIHWSLDDGPGGSISTGVGFFDHMLSHIARHGRFNLSVSCRGDLDVDAHHTVEDTGICLGECLREALGDKRGIERYGSAIVPMDESLVLVALDLSGRASFHSDLSLPPAELGHMNAELIDEFLRAFSHSALMNLHVRRLAGGNLHHLAEATFKALGRALRDAVAIRAGDTDIPSTKGSL